MSLLDDFETIVERQDNSIEVYLLKMVLKAKNPTVISLEDYKKYTNLDQSSVYIVSGFDSDPSSDQHTFVMFLGTVEDGIRKISTDELTQYLRLLQEQYQEEDSVVNNFFWSALYASNPYKLQYDCDGPIGQDNNGGAYWHYSYINSLCSEVDKHTKNSNFRLYMKQPTSQEIRNNYMTVKIDYSK